MKLTITTGLTALFLTTTTVHAHHQRQVLEECKRYRVTETYQPGEVDSYGNYKRGRLMTERQRLHCPPNHYETAHYGGHHPTPYNHPQMSHYPPYYPHTQPTRPQGQPIIVNSPAAPPQNQCGGKLVRMGLGGVLGGLAGRYAVGGRSSNKTILGTTIGAVTGSLVGRATC